MIQQLRIMVLAVVTGVVAMGVVLHVVLAPDTDAYAFPSAAALGFLGVAALVANTTMVLVGYRTTAVAPATQRTNHTGAFQSTTILRLAFAETSAIVGALLAFVVPAGGMVLYLLGAAVTLAAMALHVYPSDATIDRVRRSLEREGGKSYLREDLDVGTHRPHEGL